MKRLLIITLILLNSGLFTQAQVNPNALGLRFGGDGSLVGAEFSYQRGLNVNNRAEFDLGFASKRNHNRMYFTGIYHWVWNLTGGLNWYAGPGASLGFYNFDDSDNYINIGVGGQIGLEYDLQEVDVPLLLSLDARPMFDFLGHHSGFGWGVSFGIRYIW